MLSFRLSCISPAFSHISFHTLVSSLSSYIAAAVFLSHIAAVGSFAFKYLWGIHRACPAKHAEVSPTGFNFIIILCWHCPLLQSTRLSKYILSIRFDRISIAVPYTLLNSFFTYCLIFAFPFFFIYIIQIAYASSITHFVM